MNKFIGLAFVAAMFTVGCDDAEVIAKVAEVAEYGGVAAKAECRTNFGHSGCTGEYLDLSFTKFIDGSCLVGLGRSSSTRGFYEQIKFISRYEPASENCQVDYYYSSFVHETFSIEEGQMKFTSNQNYGSSCFNPFHAEVDLDHANCSGYNLDKFGLE